MIKHPAKYSDSIIEKLSEILIKNDIKCSFLDNETIEKHEIYKGKRVKRGLFRSSTGKIINYDVNCAYNIIKKAIPNSFENRIEALLLEPYSVRI